MSAARRALAGVSCMLLLGALTPAAHADARLSATGGPTDAPLNQLELEHSQHEWRLRISSTDPRGPWMCVVEGRRRVIIDLHGRLVAALDLAARWRVVVHCHGESQNRSTRVDLAERKHSLRITSIQK
jgi:hypothetical protein